MKDSLEVRSYRVVHAPDGAQGLDLFEQHPPGVGVLDVMMPQLDGCARAGCLGERSPSVPIIFLTSRSQTVDVVKGF